MSKPDYIFIVGLSRTGSTLTRAILNCSDEIGLGGESRFFEDSHRLGFHSRPGYRHRFAKIGDLSTDDGLEQVVDYIFGLREKSFWTRMATRIDRDEFMRRLCDSPRDERALLDLAMEVYAEGKPIRGEKTPAHIYFIPTLLEWFPNAKVIHTFRDPRAIHASNKKKVKRKGVPIYRSISRKAGIPAEFISSMNIIISWLRVTKLHHQYRQRYSDRYFLSKFEDLVGNPEAALQKLCDFLGVDFTEKMLRQTVINSSYVPRGEAAGFDQAAIDRWRKHVHPLVNEWFVLWCRKPLLDLGYAL